MTQTRILQVVRHPVTGAAQAGVSVEVRRESDNALLASKNSDGNGVAAFTDSEIGYYPGPVRCLHTQSGTTKFASGKVTGQAGAYFFETDVLNVFTGLGMGVMATIGGALAVTANGSGMNVQVASGLLLHKDGMPAYRDTGFSLTIAASDPTNPRKDYVIVREYRPGHTEWGRIDFMVLTGTPAGSPVVPTLTQSSTIWDYVLAEVSVLAAVSNIAADKVTDRRSDTGLGNKYVSTYPIGATGSIPYVPASGVPSSLGIGSAGQILKVVSGLPAWSNDLTSHLFFEVDVDTSPDFGGGVMSDTSTFHVVNSGSITLPTGTWDVWAMCWSEVEHTASGAGCSAQLTFDGTTGNLYSTGAGPGIGTYVITNVHKSTTSSGSRNWSLELRNNTGGSLSFDDAYVLFLAIRKA